MHLVHKLCVVVYIYGLSIYNVDTSDGHDYDLVIVSKHYVQSDLQSSNDPIVGM